VMSVLLLEEYAGDTAGFSLLGGDVLAGEGPWNSMDYLVELRIWFGEAIKVG